jgi:hypothetical protein
LTVVSGEAVKKTKHEPLETYLKKIETAVKFKDLIETKDDPARMFKRYARIVHPDVVPEAYKKQATAAFAKLHELYSVLTKGPAPIQVVMAGYVVTEPLAKGDIADLYAAEHEMGGEYILKIARSPADNDLMDRERATLKALVPDLTKKRDRFCSYLMPLCATTKASGRRVNIIEYANGFLSLKEIQEIMPILDFRHTVWMTNRALSLLGYIHHMGYVHGSVVPSHLMYNTLTHNFKLVDWCYSCNMSKNENVPAIVKDYKDRYAPEVMKKRPASAATDLYMLMSTMRKASDRVPNRFRDLIDWCMAGPPGSRPKDAWNVQDRWQSLAKEEYGPAKFVNFELPSH